MEDFKRTMVALDLSGMDDTLLRFVAALAPALQIRKIYFLHAIPDFTVPANVDVKFRKLFAPEQPVDEQVREKIRREVDAIFNGQSTLETDIEVVEGKPYDRLLHLAEVKDIDLLVVGHKEVSNGSGITPRRVARKSPVNILFVPPQTPEQIRQILVPIDFSDNSAKALRAALDIKQRTPEAHIRCVYIVDLPPADYYIRPINKTGYYDVLLESAQNAYRQFLEDNHIDSGEVEKIAFLPNELSNIAAHIVEYARREKTDLIVMGAQGHTGLEHFVFGSVTEKAVERSKEKPVLIVR